MTVKEYLMQAYRLDQRINSEIEEMDSLRIMATNVSSISWDEKVSHTRNTDAPFVKCLEGIIDLENKINIKVDQLVKLKEQIRDVVERVSNTDQQLILRYRYIHNLTWEQIGNKLNAGKSTIKRWHNNALKHVVLPKQPIIIKKLDQYELF